MQTLLDKNEDLKKEIEELKEKIVKLKNAPIPKKTAPKVNGKKGAKQSKKGMFGSIKGAIGLTEETKELNPKKAEAVNHIHDLLLKKSYEEVDMFIEQNKKLLFGKVKKNEPLPNCFSLVDEFGESVLVKAIKDGKSDLALHWIEKGTVDVNLTDMEGQTALMVAAKFGDDEILESLVKKANRDAKTLYTKKTALHFAAEHGHMKAVTLLLENGADPKLEDSQGRKPFQVCPNLKVRDKIKEAMEQQGTAPTREEEEFEVDLDVSDEINLGTKERSYSQDEEMKPLFEDHENLIEQRKRLRLQLEDVKSRRSPKSKIDQLIQMDDQGKKQFLGLKDEPLDDRVKKLHALVTRGMDADAVEQVEELLTESRKTHQIDKDTKDEYGETALMKAARLGFEDMLDMLLLYKCNTEVRDVEGHTALMKAAHFGKIECCRKLISEGADVNASSRNGKLTALMLAAERGHAEICEMLILEGADHKMLNSDGAMAVDLAKNEEARVRIEKAMEEHPVSRPPVQI